jgi:O-antigen/teichoic acid export membrane protein
VTPPTKIPSELDPVQPVPPADTRAAASSKHPTTGAFVVNTMANCTGYFVVVVIGFIIPRLIDRHLGQEQLGIWDFAWATISYLHLLSVGMQSSVAPYVSGYRSRSETGPLNTWVSSCLAATAISGVMVCAATLILAAWIPALMEGRWASLIGEVRLLVLVLGGCVALEAPSAVFRGVIGGHHRYGIASGIDAAVNTLRLVFLTVVLLLGGGLSALAWSTLMCAVLTILARGVMAHRVCPELRVSLRAVRWRRILEAVRFGSKTMLIAVSRVLLYQTTNVLVMAFLGPGALAVYARPAALLNHATSFTTEFARAFGPAAASLQAGQDAKALAELHLSAARYTLSLALPIIAVLTIMGGPLLRLWMGEAYELPAVIICLALGNLGLLAQQSTVQMLVGLGRHGFVAVANLVTSLTSCALVFLALSAGWGLTGVAVATAIPLTMLYGVLVPDYVRRLTRITWRFYALHVFPRPLAAVLPFAMCLVTARALREPQSLFELAMELAIAGVVLAVSLWCVVVPDTARINLRSRVLRWAG